MLRFSANIGFLWPELPLPQRIYAAKRAGFAAVELHWPYPISAQEIRLALANTGLSALALNTERGDLEAGEYGLASVPGRQQQARQHIDQAIDYARAIEAVNVHVMAGTSGHGDEAIATYIENLDYAARRAAEFNIGIIIEPINRRDRPQYSLFKVEQALDIIHRLKQSQGHDNLGLMFDCYHVQNTEGNLAARFAQALAVIKHVQIAAVPDRAEPDHGEIDYPWLLDHIDALGYSGFIGAEYQPATTTDAGLQWFETYRKSTTEVNQARVFRQFSQTELDAEYNNLEKVKDSTAHLDWYAQQSAKTRQTLRAELDISYGEADIQKLDIFYPNGVINDAIEAPARPVHVFFHGGYWRALDKSDFSFVANGFCDSDTICVVVNYGLIPTIDMPRLVTQCRQALSWIWQHIGQYGGDENLITLSGHSAGGHLVAMLMSTDWPRINPDCPTNLIKAGTSLSGVFELEPIRLCFLNQVLQLSELQVVQQSPINAMNRSRAPLSCFYGGLEGQEFRRQSELLAATWQRTEARCLPGHDHFTIVRELDSADSLLSTFIKNQRNIA